MCRWRTLPPDPEYCDSSVSGIFHRSSVGIDGSVVHGGWYQFCRRKIFEARFQIVPELMKMGASIVNQDSFALIEGVRRLSGAKVQARELRGGAGLIMAALAAEGETVMEGMEYVRRGYEDIKGDLKSLGIVIY